MAISSEMMQEEKRPQTMAKTGCFPGRKSKKSDTFFVPRISAPGTTEGRSRRKTRMKVVSREREGNTIIDIKRGGFLLSDYDTADRSTSRGRGNTSSGGPMFYRSGAATSKFNESFNSALKRSDNDEIVDPLTAIKE